MEKLRQNRALHRRLAILGGLLFAAEARTPDLCRGRALLREVASFDLDEGRGGRGGGRGGGGLEVALVARAEVQRVRVLVLAGEMCLSQQGQVGLL